jgi:hypothetical protein
LRLGLSMPQVSRLDALGDAEMGGWFAEAMGRIGSAIFPLLEPVPFR